MVSGATGGVGNLTTAILAQLGFAVAAGKDAAAFLLGLPEQPTATYLEQFPGSVASGAFAFHRDAFEAGGAPAELTQLYQADGYDKYIRAQAQRVEAGLLVSFTDAEDHPRSAVEMALRAAQTAAQTAEQAARAEAQTQRQHF